MKIVHTSTEVLTRKTTVIETPVGVRYTVIDLMNERGNVVDSIYRDEDGRELEDPSRVESLEAFMAENA